VLHALIFDFLNFKSGCLDPGHAHIARMANISKRCGVLNWVRRCFAYQDAAGRYCLAQDTNAYGIIPPSQWFGFRPAPEPRRRHRAHGAITLPCRIRSPLPATSYATAQPERRCASLRTTPATSWRARCSARNTRIFRVASLTMKLPSTIFYNRHRMS
jgi:hypothetical protein